MAPRIFIFDIILRRVFGFDAALAVRSAKRPAVFADSRLGGWQEAVWRQWLSKWYTPCPLQNPKHRAVQPEF
jgi:hypothetical protein